jgi:hypothetical protein
MNSEILVLTMGLGLITEWIKTNRAKIDQMSSEEFKILSDELARVRHEFLADL